MIMGRLGGKRRPRLPELVRSPSEKSSGYLSSSRAGSSNPQGDDGDAGGPRKRGEKSAGQQGNHSEPPPDATKDRSGKFNQSFSGTTFRQNIASEGEEQKSYEQWIGGQPIHFNDYDGEINPHKIEPE
jgi:hypothetical protein